MQALQSFVPSVDQVKSAASVAGKVVCYGAALKRAKWAFISLIVTIIVGFLSSGAEDLEDLVGVVEEVEDSHAKETVVVESVESDRVNAKATAVPGSARTSENRVSKKRPDGSVYEITHYTCDGPTLRYADASGTEVEYRCGARSGVCPSTGDAHVTTFPNGNRSCVFATPSIHCRVNGAKGACKYRGTCPRKGDGVEMARSLSDRSLSCLEGNWNVARVTVRYFPPNSSAERTQTFSIPTSEPAQNLFSVDQEMPVFYSRKHRRLSLKDSNMSSGLRLVVTALGLLTFFLFANAASFLHPTLCMLRVGIKVADKIDDKMGLDLI